MHAGKLPGILRNNSHCPKCDVKYADLPRATKILDGKSHSRLNVPWQFPSHHAMIVCPLCSQGTDSCHEGGRELCGQDLPWQGCAAFLLIFFERATCCKPRRSRNSKWVWQTFSAIYNHANLISFPGHRIKCERSPMPCPQLLEREKLD